MKRLTITVVAVAAFLATATAATSIPRHTPRQLPATYQGKTAMQWHHLAVQRRRARDWLQHRLGERTRQVQHLRKIKAPQPRDVQYAIRLAATAYGVSERDMHVVASCESGHYALASNGQYRGVYQEGPMFERGPFGRAGFSVWDPVANALTAAWTVSREGWSQWSCKP